MRPADGAHLAYIGLGANLGDARRTLEAAIDDLARLPHSRLAARSSFYASAPVDADGPDYLNAVVALDTSLDPATLLATCLSIEAVHGRERPYAHAPRTLDLDLLLVGDVVIDTPTLTLPHPRMHQRAFVLAPLVEIAPDTVIPGRGRARDHLETVGAQRCSRIVEKPHATPEEKSP
jgi:2-amino-4-hydroxy-6-hydroxymethyldihydropteridine diphosphokinase